MVSLEKMTSKAVPLYNRVCSKQHSPDEAAPLDATQVHQQARARRPPSYRHWPAGAYSPHRRQQAGRRAPVKQASHSYTFPPGLENYIFERLAVANALTQDYFNNRDKKTALNNPGAEGPTGVLTAKASADFPPPCGGNDAEVAASGSTIRPPDFHEIQDTGEDKQTTYAIKFSQRQAPGYETLVCCDIRADLDCLPKKSRPPETILPIANAPRCDANESQETSSEDSESDLDDPPWDPQFDHHIIPALERAIDHLKAEGSRDYEKFEEEVLRQVPKHILEDPNFFREESDVVGFSRYILVYLRNRPFKTI